MAAFDDAIDRPVKRHPGGRPPKLKLDDQTLDIISGLGRIHCTHSEAAAVLGVSRETFDKFLGNNKRAMEAWRQGKEHGKSALRRTQFRLAQTNAGMAIFLGKNLLGQTDQIDSNTTVTHTISVELAQLLKAEDGNSRGLPRRLEVLHEPGVAAGSPLQGGELVRPNGHVHEE